MQNSSSNVWRKPNEPGKIWNFEVNSLIYWQRFLIKGCVKKIACLSVASLRFFATRRLEISGKIRNLIQGNSLYTKKLADKASFIVRTPPRSRLRGVTERGCKGEGDEDLWYPQKVVLLFSYLQTYELA